MKRNLIIFLSTLLGVAGIFLGIFYFNSLSKLNKSFSRYLTDDVEFVLKTDNLNTLKNHVNNSVVVSSLTGTKYMDLALKKLLELDSLMLQNNVPFEFYNRLKYYCMVEKNGETYIVIESSYQFDQKVFFEYFNINKSQKIDQNIYPFFKLNLFIKGRFAVISDNIESLRSMKNRKRNKELDALRKNHISETYCQAFVKSDIWRSYDVIIEKKFVQIPEFNREPTFETFGAVEDKEMFYFILNDVHLLQRIKSKNVFREAQNIYKHQITLEGELTNWVNNSLAYFENGDGAYMLARTLNDISPTSQLESATITSLNINADSIAHFKVNEHVIYQFKPKTNYNKLFNSQKEFKWYAELSNYVIFADSRVAMTNYFDKFDKGELINFNPEYNDFVESFPSKCNHFIISRDLDSTLYPGTYNKKSTLIARSTTYSDGIEFVNTGYYFQNATVESSAANGVLLEVEISFDISRFIAVPDHIDGGNAYFMSSNDGEILFINNKGDQKWKGKIDGKIIGEPKVVDLFGNNKKQIVFNTKSKLYLLDIKGNNVANFPFSFKSEASNSVSVLDYDKTNNYRFLVATEDNHLVNIGEEGKPVEGWEFTKTGGLVKGEINHFIIKGKDYIFFSDKSGKIYMLNRRGQERIDEQIVAKKQYHYFQKGKDILSTRLFAITADKIFTLTLDNQVDSIDLEIDKPYSFIGFRDFNNDGLKEFIFTSTGYINIINQFGLVSRQIPSPTENVSKVELIYRDNTLKNIVLFDYVKEELLMLDITGTVLEGYPMKCKKFLGSFKNNKKSVNCIVDENYLRLVQN